MVSHPLLTPAILLGGERLQEGFAAGAVCFQAMFLSLSVGLMVSTFWEEAGTCLLGRMGVMAALAVGRPIFWRTAACNPFLGVAGPGGGFGLVGHGHVVGPESRRGERGWTSSSGSAWGSRMRRGGLRCGWHGCGWDGSGARLQEWRTPGFWDPCETGIDVVFSGEILGVGMHGSTGLRMRGGSCGRGNTNWRHDW